MNYLTFFAFLLLLSFASCQESGLHLAELISNEEADPIDYFKQERDSVYQLELTKAKTFLSKNPTYNQNTVFLIDMKIPSGTFRFFVHNITKDSIEHKALVAHGSGSTYSDDSLTFSNIPNSYQTSLGKYKIGNSYAGNFGKSYKLHGLDPTNNKAFARYVVLHPYSCVPDEEQDHPICESLGCPMVSNEFIKILYPIIDGSRKPILMVIYY